jgi:flavin reductase (DIM6/NTAB) family NADH-FMN oxidoreductase RutF
MRDPLIDSCRRLYRKLAAGVAIVSANGPAGPMGMTVSTVTSLSLEPPLMSASLAAGSGTLAAIKHSGSFGVQLLSEHQQPIAEDFASAHGPRFAGRGHRTVAGAPLLAGTLAWSVCRLVDSRRYGDHVLIVGEVVVAGTEIGSPLLWHSRGFAALRPTPEPAESRR